MMNNFLGKNKWLMGLIACCLSVSSVARDGSKTRVLISPDVNQKIEHFVEAGAVPMLYMHVEDRSGAVVYQHSAVNTSLVPGTPINGDSWFRIWSMSKLVTITIIMDLVEDGLITLADPVTAYIPEFADLKVAVGAEGKRLTDSSDPAVSLCPVTLEPARASITLLDLLNHEAGFYYAVTGIACMDDPLAAANLPAATDSDDLVSKLAGLPLIMQPRTVDYYGTNTTVLGVVAERVTGKPLNDLVAERITRPLGISGLQYGLPDGVTLLPVTSGSDGNLRPAHPGELDIFGPQVPDYDPAHPLYLGGEGMLATTGGYADFLRMILNRGNLNGHQYLHAESIDQIAAPWTQLNNDYGYNGYNLWVNNGRLSDGSQGIGQLWIGGGYEGTHFWIDNERGLVGLIMTQIFSPPETGNNMHEILRESFYLEWEKYGHE